MSIARDLVRHRRETPFVSTSEVIEPAAGRQKKEVMAKRMLVMLVVTALIVARARVREVQADSDGDRAGGVVSAAARGGDDDRRPAGAVAGDARARSARSPRCRASPSAPTCRASSIASRSSRGSSVREGDVLALLDTRQEQAQLAAAEAQRELARVNFERMQGLLNERVDLARGVRPRHGRPAADRGARRRNPRGDRPQDDPRAVLRRPRHPAGRTSASTCPAGDALVTLQSLNPIYVNFGVPQQAAGQVRVGRTVRITAERSGGRRVHRPRHGDRLGRRRGDAQHPGAGDARQSRRQAAARDVRAGRSRSSGAPSRSSSLPASAISYAPLRRSVFVVADLKDPKGKTYRGVRQQFVKLGAARGDQIAVVSGVKPGDEVVTSGVFKLRNGAAVQINNTVRPGNNPAPKPENS